MPVRRRLSATSRIDSDSRLRSASGSGRRLRFGMGSIVADARSTTNNIPSCGYLWPVTGVPAQSFGAERRVLGQLSSPSARLPWFREKSSNEQGDEDDGYRIEHSAIDCWVV